MKSYLLSALFIALLACNASAQEEFPAGSEGNNELKLNLFYVILEVIELDYERILNPDASVGLAANYWFDEYSDYSFMITPYFRFYPAQKLRASGFFIEANAAVLGYESYVNEYSNGFYSSRQESKVGVGAGIAVGGKFISRSGLFGEVFGGVGRVFADDSYLEIYPRVGISIGKRF